MGFPLSVDTSIPKGQSAAYKIKRWIWQGLLVCGEYRKLISKIVSMQLCLKHMNSVRSNSLSLKYLWFTPSGEKISRFKSLILFS